MSKSKRIYLLDSSALIAAHRSYYGFDFCPGFWEAILRGHQQGYVHSIDRVHAELKKGKDQLWQWADEELPDGFFLDTYDSDTALAFAPTMAWVAQHPKFSSSAKAEYAQDHIADGWLVAAASHHNMTVVTREVAVSDNSTKVKIPNVCKQFDVRCINTYDMLRDLKVSLTLG